MLSEFLPYLPELISIAIIAIVMSISPGADFLIITRNSLSYGRKSGLFCALGISLAIWVHVAYSVAGLAIIISQSIILFSIIKYLGAAYLIYMGWQSFRSSQHLTIEKVSNVGNQSSTKAFKIGFISNALNPKTTLFFLSIFTQVVDPNTPLVLQLIYGGIISLAHLFWFSAVSLFLSQQALLKQFLNYKRWIEKIIGTLLIGFGLKVASMSHH